MSIIRTIYQGVNMKSEEFKTKELLEKTVIV